MMTQILLSPIFRASDFTVNVKNSLPRFNLHQKISLLWKCVIRSEELENLVSARDPAADRTA